MRYVCILFVVISQLSAQHDITTLNDLPKKAQKQYKKAMGCVEKGKLTDATQKLELLLSSHPQFVEGREVLISVYNKTENTKATIPHLEHLYNNNQVSNYKLNYTLATIYEEDGRFQEAIDIIQTIDKDQIPEKQKKRITRYEKELTFREHAYQNPVPFKSIRLDSNINTQKLEYLPTFNADGSTMLYVSKKNCNSPDRSINEDIYMTMIDQKGNSQFPGKSIDVINTPYDEGSPMLSQDGKILVYATNHPEYSSGNFDLLISFYKNNTWTTPKNMGPAINSRSWEAQPCFSPDNKTLYFSSKRNGGHGGADIWKVSLNENNRWGEPVNLGPQINTSGHEESPYIHPDGKTLYFRSKGHIGLGDYDIFLSKKDENENWSTPTNLGYPINSKGSEGALYVNLEGTKAYYATDSNNDYPNQLDIHYFELPKHLRPDVVTYIKILARDNETKGIINAKVQLKSVLDTSTSKPYIDAHTNGTLLTTIVPGDYALHVSKDGYVFHSEHIVVDSIVGSNDPFLLEVFLDKIEPPIVNNTNPKESKPITLNNVFFESGSDELLSSSDIEINKLADLLTSNLSIKIVITGHTDNVGKDQDNLILSENRAKSVYNALVAKGIDKSRLAYKGKGETEPIASNKTIEGRRTNRRTEFIIIN